MTANRLPSVNRPTRLIFRASVRRPLHVRQVVLAFRCAIRGLADAWRSQPNLRLHAYAGTAVVAAGILCRLSTVEWLWITLAVGLVVFAELMNTAIEQSVDLVVGLRPDPLARQVKDIAAGCVLVAAVLAAIIGGLTFLPHVLARLAG